MGESLHPPAPIFQIQVHGDAALGSHLHIATDVGSVLFERLSQLSFAVAAGAFAEEVDGAGTGTLDPVETLAVIDEAEDFYAVQQTLAAGPACDALHGLQLAIADAR